MERAVDAGLGGMVGELKVFEDEWFGGPLYRLAFAEIQDAVAGDDDAEECDGEERADRNTGVEAEGEKNASNGGDSQADEKRNRGVGEAVEKGFMGFEELEAFGGGELTGGKFEGDGLSDFFAGITKADEIFRE